MKFANVSKGLLLGLIVLLASSVFASNTANKGSIEITSPVTVSGTQLAAGEYSLKWEGTGPSVQLNIMKGNKVVATTPARVVDLGASSNNSAAIVTKGADGSRTLSQVRFNGKKYALAIGGEDTSSSEANGASK